MVPASKHLVEKFWSPVKGKNPAPLPLRSLACVTSQGSRRRAEAPRRHARRGFCCAGGLRGRCGLTLPPEAKNASGEKQGRLKAENCWQPLGDMLIEALTAQSGREGGKLFVLHFIGWPFYSCTGIFFSLLPVSPPQPPLSLLRRPWGLGSPIDGANTFLFIHLPWQDFFFLSLFSKNSLLAYR